MRVMFTTDIAGSDTSTPLALTWNGGGSPIPVKVAKEGSLAGVYAKEVATNVFKYISGYVTLEMAFDGTNLVIVGNPVVLSGTGYTIYADGHNDYEEYSTSEVKTNKKWIDGKPIYRKTFEYTSAGSKSLSDLSIDTPIRFEGLVLNNDTNWRPLDGYLSTLTSNQLNGACVDYNKSSGNLSVGSGGTGMGYSFTKAYVTIYYTKTTD